MTIDTRIIRRRPRLIVNATWALAGVSGLIPLMAGAQPDPTDILLCLLFPFGITLAVIVVCAIPDQEATAARAFLLAFGPRDPDGSAWPGESAPLRPLR